MSDVTHTNRLMDSTSPYLLQHAHNPVEWFPWGAEAMEKSQREGKPIFLSIGYSACHWCHVMEHQSFENAAIAAVMNEHFVNIKVDREERPDLDELYMLATQLMTGQGGWPMSVWLTPAPELEPFYAGTYFPPEDGYGRPGFPRLLQGLAEAWKNRRGDLLAQAKKVVEAIRMHANEGGAGGTVDGAGWLRLGLEHQEEAFDDVNGGMGGAPKFPPHQAVGLWVHMLEGEAGRIGAFPAADIGGTPLPEVARAMLVKTLDGMMRGGIYDHVGGGFARYSTDARWHVPHFEKMLYDTAQLAPSYAVAGVRLGREDYAHVARESLDFFLREMCSPAGGFYSSLDADSSGEEGLYYVWTADDVKAALGDEADVALMREWLEVKQNGNWDESPVAGGNVLEMAVDVEELGRRHGVTASEMRKRLDGLLKQMRAYRERRQRPGMDDKILTSWNGLMISALAICGRVLREPKYLEAAHRAMGFLLTKHMEGGRRLLRVSRNDVAHVDAFLDDHAYLLNGLMDLIDSTLPTSLPGTMARKRALELADVLIAEFEDHEHGGFFFTSSRHENLFARMKNAADNATPSANGVAIRALLRLARVSGKEKYREVAVRAVGAFATNIARRPEWFSTIVLALAEDAAAEARMGGILPALGRMPTNAENPGILRLSVDAPGAVRAGDFVEVTARMVIAPGYHIQPRQPVDKEAYRTVAHVRGEMAVEGETWTLPDASEVEGGLGYAGEVKMRVRWRVPLGTKAGEYAMRVSVLAQACSGNACLPPERAGAGFTLIVQG